MKKQVQGTVMLSLRPQLFILLAAAVALACGVLWSVVRPAQSKDANRPAVRVEQWRNRVPIVMRPALPPVNCSEQACLALTFDDGPSNVVTPQILTVLAKHHVHATFFVVGSHVPGNEQLLRRMYQDGHEIGSHSWSHPDFTTLAVDQIAMQIDRTQAVVAAAGVPAPTLFRPPYGSVNAVVQAHVPMTFAMWNVDPEDWLQKNPKDIIARVEANVRPGRVVDLHDIHQPMADALDQLLTDLQPHYQFVTFSQLFNLAPGQRGIYYGR